MDSLDLKRISDSDKWNGETKIGLCESESGFAKRNAPKIYSRKTQLYKIGVKLSQNQKRNLSKAFHNREIIVLRLSNNTWTGSDTLFVQANVFKRLNKNRQLKKGMDIKLTKTNIRKQVGGSLLSSILSIGRTLLPTIGKRLGLSALSGLASESASQIIKKMSGQGVKTSGFLVPQN